MAGEQFTVSILFEATGIYALARTVQNLGRNFKAQELSLARQARLQERLNAVTASGQFKVMGAQRQILQLQEQRLAYAQKVSEIERTAAIGGALAGVGIFGLVKMTSAYQPVADAMGQLKLQIFNATTAQLGMSQAQAQSLAMQTAINTSTKVHGTLIEDNLRLLGDLFTVYGNLQDAMKTTPLMAQIRQGLSLLQGRGQFADLSDQDLLQLAKAAEMWVGPGPAFAGAMGDLWKLQVATRGLVTPQMIFRNFVQGGPAMRQLSPEGLAHMAVMFQDFATAGAGGGGAQGGRAGQALYQFMNLAYGNLSKTKREIFQGLGLLTPAGALVNRQLALADPFQWVENVLVPTVAKQAKVSVPYLQAHPKVLQDMIMQILGGPGAVNQNVARFITTMAVQPARIAKETELLKYAADPIQAALTQANTDAISNLGKSMHNLTEVLSGPVWSVANTLAQKLTGVVDAFMKFVSKQPLIGGMAGGFLAGMSLIGLGTVFVAAAKYLGLIKAFASLLAVFGIGAEAAMGPLGWILLAFQALITLAPLIISNWGKITKFFSDLWNTIATGFSGLLWTIRRWLASVLVHIPGVGPAAASAILGLKPTVSHPVLTNPLLAGMGTAFRGPGPTGTAPSFSDLLRGSQPQPINLTINMHGVTGETPDDLSRRIAKAMTEELQRAVIGTSTAAGIHESHAYHYGRF